MDPILTDNRDRWNALAEARVHHTVPFLDFTREDAARHIYRFPFIPDVSGRHVLCLASGGGQDSAAFGLLGAVVTVLDLSDTQLARDREAAAHHGYQVTTVQGDMRDLSMFTNASFDIVWQEYSINYCPEAEPVIREAARVLRPGGLYYLTFANPDFAALGDWNGEGYPLRGLCIDGEEVTHYFHPTWDVEQPDGRMTAVPFPHVFRHNLSTMMNTMVDAGFHFLRLTEWTYDDEPPVPGSWAHRTHCVHPEFHTYWRLGDAITCIDNSPEMP